MTAYTVSPRVVATTLVVSESTVRRMCALGELPCVRVRRQWRIAEDWIAWMAQRAQVAVEEHTTAEKMRRIARTRRAAAVRGVA